jgi:hypothetical protein
VRERSEEAFCVSEMKKILLVHIIAESALTRAMRRQSPVDTHAYAASFTLRTIKRNAHKMGTSLMSSFALGVMNGIASSAHERCRKAKFRLGMPEAQGFPASTIR